MPGSRPSEARFRARSELLDFLLELSAVTAETLDLDRLLPQVAEFIHRAIPHDIIAMMLYSERSHGLRIRYARGHRDEIVRSLLIPLGEGITGAAAALREPILVGDVLSDPRYLPGLDAVRSELAVPMTARGKLVGVIDIQSTRLNAFSPQDSSLLRLLASRVAASIDNARLYKRVERQNRTSRLLLHLSQEFSSTLHLDELLGNIAQAVKTLINYDAFSILLVDPEQKALRHRFSQRYDQRVDLDNIPLGKGITGAAAEMREPVRVDDTMQDPRYIASHADIRSELAIPLVVQDRVIGIMDLESDRIAHFTEEHVRTLSLIAPQIAGSVENARLYEELAQREQRIEQDLKAARKLQSVLLPRQAPELPGLRIAFGLRPAREITGDLYDVIEQAGECALIVFGDSSGKGAAAALYGALVTGVVRSLGLRCRGPAELMRLLNSVLMERRLDAHYVTLLLMNWDAARREFSIANAGAFPPLVCRGGERLKLRIEGIPLGLLEEREYDQITMPVQPGDTVLLYSDGIVDQRNAAGEDYGASRLFHVLRDQCAQTPQGIIKAVFADLDQFAAGRRIGDDQTLMAIQIS
ncbi:MAG: GAF domain-containing protein [Acidobacteria bacterium]|nr:GAF domain-containing protein [Acidobacteriota bacterium]MBI3280020.1 GAF domain-containing protein [Acidobacteriota bacterium]